MKATKSQFEAWRNARAHSYAHSRSPIVIAAMLVELEDKIGVPPEFEIDEEWPAAVRMMRRG